MRGVLVCAGVDVMVLMMMMKCLASFFLCVCLRAHHHVIDSGGVGRLVRDTIRKQRHFQLWN
jgi:hypothetical protein